MFTSYLWDSLFDIQSRYNNTEIFLIDKHIPALRLGHADKPAVFAAGFCAQEWQSSVLLLKFMERLAASAQNSGTLAGIAVKKAFQKRSVVIIPAVCPGKMNVQGDAPTELQLKRISDYLSFCPASVFLALSGEGDALFAAPGNAQSGVLGETVAKVLAACSRLQPQSESNAPAAALCEQIARNNNRPAFMLSPASLKASAIERTYRSLEESLIVSALL